MALIVSVQEDFTATSIPSGWQNWGGSVNRQYPGGFFRCSSLGQFGGIETTAQDLDISGSAFIWKVPSEPSSAGTMSQDTAVVDSGGDRYYFSINKSGSSFTVAGTRFNGAGTLQETVFTGTAYSHSATPWMAIAHDSVADDVVFLVGTDSAGVPGTWTEVGRAGWSGAITKTGLRLLLGLFGVSTTGTATWDNINLPVPLIPVLSGVSNKVYDGTTSTSGGTLSTTGIDGGDDASLLASSITFGDKNVDTDKAVTASSISLTGADAGNYCLLFTSAADLADITELELAPAVTINNKVYDGTTDATIASRSLPGKVDTDDVAVVGGTAAFADAGPGNGIAVHVTGLSLSGTDAANYSLSTDEADSTANILSGGGGSAPLYGQLWPR